MGGEEEGGRDDLSNSQGDGKAEQNNLDDFVQRIHTLHSGATTPALAPIHAQYSGGHVQLPQYKTCDCGGRELCAGTVPFSPGHQ